MASFAPHEHEMLRIQRDSDRSVTKLVLSGRIQADCIACIRSALTDGCERKILDLREITLIDIEGVRFLICCEEQGIELLGCPPYVRQWILCERAESALSEPAHSD
jgi:hypothetical protein